jgi:hypothetical protein
MKLLDAPVSYSTMSLKTTKQRSKRSLHKINDRTALTQIHSSVEDITEDIYHTYSEESRGYRRTVFTHEDWVKHRSSNRFFRRLVTFTDSGIYKSLFKEVAATTSIAAFVVFWNMLFGEYQDLQSVTHNGPFHDSVIPILALPLAPFTLSSPALGLLLGMYCIYYIVLYCIDCYFL